jgi:hypothetical protein
MAQSLEQVQFPRWYPPRNNSPAGTPAAAISNLGDDFASLLTQIKQQQDQKQQDALANALMNNGQSPGAPPYVRAAVYPDDDQGDDPGPVPFDFTSQPYTGGQAQQGMLSANDAAQQKIADALAKQKQQQFANAMMQRSQSLRQRQLDLTEKGLNVKEEKVANPGKPDSYDELDKSLKSAFPGKDDAVSGAQLGQAQWTYPTGDPNTTTLQIPTGEDVDNPAFVPAKPNTSWFGYNGDPGTPPEIPAKIPGLRGVQVPTGQAKTLFERLQALNSGTPQMIGKGNAVVGGSTPAGNGQIAQAQAWLADPKNKSNPMYADVQKKLQMMTGQ